MKKYTFDFTWFFWGFLMFAFGWPFMFVGCTHLDPGADPVVVRAEQVETGASATFELVVKTDNNNRSFWITNAPAFHNFAEWLRSPISIQGTNHPRGIAMIFQLDADKVAYKSHGGSSNALVASTAVLQSALTQSTAWLTISSNSTPIIP